VSTNQKFADVQNALPDISIKRQQQEATAKRLHASMERRRRIAFVAYPLLSLVAVVVLWDLACRFTGVPDYLLPRPGAVVDALVENAATLSVDTAITLGEIVAGFGLSIVLGVPLALAIFMSPTFERTIYPALVASQAMPKVAIAPLLIVWFGFGFLPKVMIAFLVAFFPIVINTVAGLTAIEAEKIVLARSMGLSGLDTFLKIRLPNALPNIFAGLKIAVTLAVVGAVVGEFVGGNGGLGYQLLAANGSMNTALLFGVLVLLTLLGVVLFMIVGLAERICVPRHHSISYSQAGGGR